VLMKGSLASRGGDAFYGSPVLATMAASSITRDGWWAQLMLQTVAALKAKGIELGQPLSDKDATLIASVRCEEIPQPWPESQAEIDAKLGQIKEMPKEAFEQAIVMASKGKGKITPEQAIKITTEMADKEAFSITAEELADQTVAAFKVRAAELGQTLSEEDAALLTSSMGQASTTLPESQAEVDEKLGQIKEMGGADFEGMITMIKGMAA